MSAYVTVHSVSRITLGRPERREVDKYGEYFVRAMKVYSSDGECLQLSLFADSGEFLYAHNEGDSVKVSDIGASASAP